MSTVEQRHESVRDDHRVAGVDGIGHMTDSPPPLPDKQLLRLFDALTPREREVVLLVARGLSNNEIAAQLFVSPLTVKTHSMRAMTKVSARDRAPTGLVSLPRRRFALPVMTLANASKAIDIGCGGFRTTQPRRITVADCGRLNHGGSLWRLRPPQPAKTVLPHHQINK
ncbi:MAG: two component transcriptional regulator [Pseudonocardiales bacterium]|nr:two component transcriptional regulator [Pseudonocardiales bacterium]